MLVQAWQMGATVVGWPVSGTHAIISALVGFTLVEKGLEGVNIGDWNPLCASGLYKVIHDKPSCNNFSTKLYKVIYGLFVSSFVALFVGLLLYSLLYKTLRYRPGQWSQTADFVVDRPRARARRGCGLFSVTTPAASPCSPRSGSPSPPPRQ